MTKLNTFFAKLSQYQVNEYLYSHSVCDIANDVGVLPDEVRAWLDLYMKG